MQRIGSDGRFVVSSKPRLVLGTAESAKFADVRMDVERFIDGTALSFELCCSPFQLHGSLAQK